MAHSPIVLVCLMCLALVSAMTGFAAYWSLQPTLQTAWSMNNAAAGWLSGAFFGGSGRYTVSGNRVLVRVALAGIGLAGCQSLFLKSRVVSRCGTLSGVETDDGGSGNVKNHVSESES